MTSGEIKEIEHFVEYVRHTLIPDLQEAGQTATAEDFGVATDIIRDLLEEREQRA